MRPFKFRAWTGKGYEEDVYIYQGIAYFDNGIEIVPRPEWVLEQYTGLKDKNGKEIYEGDIVVFHDLGLCHEGEDKKHVIKWDVVGDRDYPWECHGFEFTAYTETIKVIGNIHENPELKDD